MSKSGLLCPLRRGEALPVAREGQGLAYVAVQHDCVGSVDQKWGGMDLIIRKVIYRLFVFLFIIIAILFINEIY